MDFRLRGAKGQDIRLLRAARIRRAGDLAPLDPHDLYQILDQVNRQHQILPAVPDPTVLGDWIRQARHTAQDMAAEVLPGDDYTGLGDDDTELAGDDDTGLPGDDDTGLGDDGEEGGESEAGSA